MHAYDGVARVLEREGITHIFGVPGGFSVKVFDAVGELRDRIRPILARHEQSAACMADMYGRMTGRPGIAVGQGVFMGSSGMFGVIEAFHASSPMVVLTDTSESGLAQHGPYQGGTGDYATTNLPQMFAGTTKYVTVPTTPNEAVHGVELALQHAVTGRPGPAVVIFRPDAIMGMTDDDAQPRLHEAPRAAVRTPAQPSPSDVRAVAQLLAEAQRPVIVGGNGINVSRAYEPLAAVARRAGVPVVTTTRGRAAIAGVDEWCAGPMGLYGDPTANHAVAEADIVLVLGSRLSPNDTLLESPWLLDPERQRIVQVDIDPRHLGWTIPVERGIVADVGAFLEALLAVLEEKPDLVARRANRLAEMRGRLRDDAPELYDSGVPIRPQRVCHLINENLPDDQRVVLDAGNNRLFMQHFYRSRRPGNVFLPGGVAGMGWGPCAAVAAGIIDPSHRTLCVVGDGGMFMSVHVLSSAVEHGTPVTFLVMNNSALGSIVNAQRDKPVASTFPPTDFAAIARAFGADGRRIERDSDFVSALKETETVEGPVLLDVVTDPAESFRKVVQRDPSKKRRAPRQPYTAESPRKES